MFQKGKKDEPTRVLMYESVGFLAIITLSWLDELLSLPSLLLHGNHYVPDFHESTVEMLLVLAVWLLVFGSTRRLLVRVRYLEAFMRVCAWCHRVHFKGRWMPMEQFFQQGFDTPTTHGICPHCLAQSKASLNLARETRSETSTSNSTASQAKDPKPATQQAAGQNRRE